MYMYVRFHQIDPTVPASSQEELKHQPVIRLHLLTKTRRERERERVRGTHGGKEEFQD